jgi:hypothetical protein
VINITIFGDLDQQVSLICSVNLDMKTEQEIKAELTRLELIVNNAEGIDREDCPALSSRIMTLNWMLGIKDEEGKAIKLECVD